jgi:hypothetical protein
VASKRKVNKMENVAAGRAEPGTDKKDTDEAESGKRDGHDHAHGFTVSVIYNGVTKNFQVQQDETDKQLLDQAVQAFGSIPNAHLLSLFTTDGRELIDGQTIKEAGIKPHEELLLRPGAVRGG